MPYDILYTQYKNLFFVIQLKFYAMLETAGMLEDFQTFCDLYGEKNMIILADFCSISSITYSAGEKLGKREKLHWERNWKAFRIRPQII